MFSFQTVRSIYFQSLIISSLVVTQVKYKVLVPGYIPFGQKRFEEPLTTAIYILH